MFAEEASVRMKVIVNSTQMKILTSKDRIKDAIRSIKQMVERISKKGNLVQKVRKASFLLPSRKMFEMDQVQSKNLPSSASAGTLTKVNECLPRHGIHQYAYESDNLCSRRGELAA